jgi:hypothetical protein
LTLICPRTNRYNSPGFLTSASGSSPPDSSKTSEMYSNCSHPGLRSIPPTHERPSCCDWPGCSSMEVFLDRISCSQHVSTIHIPGVLQNTSGLCTWPGCTKSKLDTSKRLETHVTNVHLDPLRCTLRGCGRTEPFGRKGDLDRHIASVHKQGRTWKCPRKDCTRYTRGFPRKDKLNDHVREKCHGFFQCNYHHCWYRGVTRFLTEAQLSSHHDKRHGNFECSIASCKGTVSAFDLHGLEDHLSFHHAASGKPVVEIVERVVNRSRGDKHTVCEGDLDGFEISCTCHECAEKSQRASN